jgi:hypothetical protein
MVSLRSFRGNHTVGEDYALHSLTEGTIWKVAKCTGYSKGSKTRRRNYVSGLGRTRIPAVWCSSENYPERKHTKTAPITKRQAVYRVRK